MAVLFSINGHVVDGSKTLVKVDCRGSWGESNNDDDDE